MRCYRVLVHGRICRADADPDGHSELVQPKGFYANRYVLAATEQGAANRALGLVRKDMADRDALVRAGKKQLSVSVVEVDRANIASILKPINKGYSFYIAD